VTTFESRASAPHQGARRWVMKDVSSAIVRWLIDTFWSVFTSILLLPLMPIILVLCAIAYLRTEHERQAGQVIYTAFGVEPSAPPFSVRQWLFPRPLFGLARVEGDEPKPEPAPTAMDQATFDAHFSELRAWVASGVHCEADVQQVYSLLETFETQDCVRYEDVIVPYAAPLTDGLADRRHHFWSKSTASALRQKCID